MYDMAPMGPIWWISGLLVVVLLLAVSLASLAHLQPPRRRPVAPPEDAPVELLRHRLAAGEIDDEDYLTTSISPGRPMNTLAMEISDTCGFQPRDSWIA